MMLILNVSGQDATSWLARSRRGERLIVIATVLLVARTCPKFHVELFWIEQLSGPPFLTYSWYSLSLLPPRTHQQAALHRYRIFESLRRQSLKRTNSTMQTQQSTATMMTTTTMVSTVNLFFVILFYLLHYNPRERNPLNPYHTAFSLFALVWFDLIWFHLVSFIDSAFVQMPTRKDYWCLLLLAILWLCAALPTQHRARCICVSEECLHSLWVSRVWFDRVGF